MSDDLDMTQTPTCGDCGGKSYGWNRCAICEVARVMERADPKPVEVLELFGEAS